MARNRFNKDAVIVAQNATMPAVTLAAAIMAANPEHATTTESALRLYDAVHSHVAEKSMQFGGVESLEDFLEAEPASNSRGPRGNTTSPTRQGAPSGGDPGSVQFNSGKHRGKSIAEVHASEPDYLTWAVEKLRNEYMVGRISAYLAQQS